MRPGRRRKRAQYAVCRSGQFGVGLAADVAGAATAMSRAERLFVPLSELEEVKVDLAVRSSSRISQVPIGHAPRRGIACQHLKRRNEKRNPRLAVPSCHGRR